MEIIKSVDPHITGLVNVGFENGIQRNNIGHVVKTFLNMPYNFWKPAIGDGKKLYQGYIYGVKYEITDQMK